MEFLILAISYKELGLCVAGVEYGVFPVHFVRLGHNYNQTNECHSLSTYEMKINDPNYQDEYYRIGDVINVDVRKMPNNGCQTENYELLKINEYVKTVNMEEIEEICDSLPLENNIFGCCKNLITPSNIHSITNSLFFCEVNNLEINKIFSWGKTKLKASFIYNGQKYYDFSVTDSAFCARPTTYGTEMISGSYHKAYILLSLPYNETAKKIGFYKYIAGIIIV